MAIAVEKLVVFSYFKKFMKSRFIFLALLLPVLQGQPSVDGPWYVTFPVVIEVFYMVLDSLDVSLVNDQLFFRCLCISLFINMKHVFIGKISTLESSIACNFHNALFRRYFDHNQPTNDHTAHTCTIR